MTRDDIRAEVDAAVDEFAQLIAGQEQESTGVRPAPSVMESVTELALQPFDIGLEQETSAQALEGGGVVGGGVGACCYDDGTCDNLTEIDCPGNWQGAGTNCSTSGICLGACCYSDGSCFDSMTKADCENATGVFQDFQSDCGPPNPCMSPCNGCGFAAFDGSGRKFLTKTTTASLTQNATHQGFCALTDRSYTITTNTTKEEHIDNVSCGYSCSCSGSAVANAETGTCTAAAVGCGSDTYFRGSGGCVFGADSCSSGCTPTTTQGAPGAGCSSESHSADTRTTTYSCTVGSGTGPTQTYSGTVTEVLSNECIP